MILDEFGPPLAYETALFIQSLDDTSLSLDEIGDLSVTVGCKLRSLAIMALLSKGDRTLFGQNLTRSGRLRLQHLKRLRRAGALEDHYGASAHIEGLIDALAASDIFLSREIVGMSRRSWLRDSEYEDDFCYAQLIHQVVVQEAHEPTTSALIERYEQVLDGEPSARLDVCRALVNHDQSSFDQSLNGLIQEQVEQIAADKARFQLEEPEIMSQRLIFVEGLAILRLATLHGLKTEPDYLFCPSIARLTEAVDTPEE